MNSNAMIGYALKRMESTSDKSRLQILIKVWLGGGEGTQSEKEVRGADFRSVEIAGEEGTIRRVCVAYNGRGRRRTACATQGHTAILVDPEAGHR